MTIYALINKLKETMKTNNPGIRVRGAREHNLKNLDIFVPRGKITVMTGLSGSGKSSLAFDTIYAEGQRRYVESLSAYARQFLEQLKKPELDSIEGLSPAIAIDQKSVSHNPRSTVGTVTEISDYLRLLYSKVGVAICPEHKIPAAGTTPQKMIQHLNAWPEGTKFYVLAPVAQGKKGEFLAEFQKWLKKGYVKARVDGNIVDLATAKKLAKTKSHDIDLIVDQLILKESFSSRLAESLNAALSLAGGRVIFESLSGQKMHFSLHSACPTCGYSFPELEPRFFSFNNPRGACEACHGLGTTDIQEVEVLEDGEGFRVLKNVKYENRTVAGKTSVENDEDEGNGGGSHYSKCEACQGTRLKPQALAIQIDGKNISEVSDYSLADLRIWTAGLPLDGNQKIIAEKIQKQILSRIDYLLRVGVGYLSLSRPSRTLSGGESQRIRLATQVGSALIGVLYVMDEPSIGLHPRDHQRLIVLLKELRDRGNTILLVEHDEETIREADYVVDLGPRAGRLGGALLAEGTPQEIIANSKSLTGQYLSGKQKIPIPKVRRPGNGKYLEVLGATGNNLKNVDLKIPLGTLTAITGVSGSGKSTLILDTMYRAISQTLYGAMTPPEPYGKLEGLEHLDKVIEINQQPIGRTPRSTPATYTGLFPLIRDVFAALPESRMRGYIPGRFSFNVKGGRCERCLGHGQIRLEMHFLADVFVTCELCQGRRYNKETLAVHLAGKSIHDVLSMSVEEALEFFKNYPPLRRKLETLHRVGLDYMTLGQSSTTLSGGEAQRIKLSRELSKRGTGKTLYILDEPTTGLHFEDVRRLLEFLQELVEQGNTVVVIEHHLDLIRSADHIIDIGPEAGPQGGRIVATGTPESLRTSKESITAQFL